MNTANDLITDEDALELQAHFEVAVAIDGKGHAHENERCVTAPEVVTAFSELLMHHSLLAQVMADGIMQALSRYQYGQLVKDDCERLIGEYTSAFVARQLVGNDKELILAMSEELDALRTKSMALLDTLKPTET